MGKQYEALIERLADIQALNAAGALFEWDRETLMPKGGLQARAQHSSVLSRMAHELLTADETGALLEQAAAELADADYDSNEASLVRVLQRDYEEATRLPSSFVAQLSRETSLAQAVWVEAREKQEFSLFRPNLERIIELKQQEAEYRGYDEHPYDALLGQYERGMTTAQVKQIFDNHRDALVDLIAAIADAPPVDDSVLHRHYDIEKQRMFGLEVIKAFGFDFDRGVQAVAVHPFAMNISVNDVRITTRFYPDFLNPSLFGMMHEAGHGMYEQGVAQDLDGTPLANGTSLGVHESQSRLWENLVGRSRAFWAWALPKLKETFPEQTADVDLDGFYRAINRVERSFIRVEADEATYNLHIILRFELEQELLQGKLAVKDLPEAWNDRFQGYFGLTPPNDAQGVLQDVHWSVGLFGYFPTYALGNLLSVQYYNQAIKDHPSIPDEIARGEFGTLRGWLRTNIHQHGRKFTGDELTRRVAGEGIQSRDYIQYLRTKFGEIYGL